MAGADLLRRAAAALQNSTEDHDAALAELFTAMANFADVHTELLLPEGPGTLVAVARTVLRDEPT